MELEQKRIVYCRRQLAQTSACTETADCIVPDAFPDVGRVVYACGTAAIGDHAPQNGRLLISGTVQAVISYEPENGGGLRRLEVPLSFAHIEECAQLDSSSVCLVECRVSAVEASVVNSRKLSIAADLVLTAECYDKTACEYTENIADDHTELLSETCERFCPTKRSFFRSPFWRISRSRKQTVFRFSSNPVRCISLNAAQCATASSCAERRLCGVW